MFKKIDVFVDKYNLLDDCSKYVVGVSGGSDSMLLIEYLLNRVGSDRLVVAHVNHGFREQSKDEYVFVEGYCDRHGIVFEGYNADVPIYMEEMGLSAQLASRELRYGFYKDVMDRHGINSIVLGHHGDDLIETVIMRNIVGSGSRGLVGMLPKSENDLGFVIRPLLGMTKDEVYEVARRLSLTWYEDPSNKKDDYFRNRIRNRVLPELKKENDAVHSNFLKVSVEREEDNDFIESFVDAFFEDHVDEVYGVFVVDRHSFNGLHGSVKKRVVKRLLESVGVHHASRDVVDKLVDLAVLSRGTDFNKVCEGVQVVVGRNTFYVMDEVSVGRIKDGKMGYMELDGLDRLSMDDRFSNGKRVVKSLKANYVCEAFRKNAFVRKDADGFVTDIFYFKS